MTAVRTSIRFALGLALLVAIAIVITMSRSGALPRGFAQEHVHRAPAAAPAALNDVQPREASNTGAASEESVPSTSGSTVPGANSGDAGATVRSGGPADAGPGVVYGDQVGPLRSCGPRPCPR